MSSVNCSIADALSPTFAAEHVSQTRRKVRRSRSRTDAGRFDSPESVSQIPGFVKYHSLDTNEMLEPLSSYKTFNECDRVEAIRLTSPDSSTANSSQQRDRSRAQVTTVSSSAPPTAE